jgi:hypothetical protein
MGLIFYPHTEDAQKGSLNERVDVLLEAAGRYKAIILDDNNHAEIKDSVKKLSVPHDLSVSYNWEEIAHILREIKELPEGSKLDKEKKGRLLVKLAEVYEVLRGAKMPKLEAVRLALINEANQLLGSASQVA